LRKQREREKERWLDRFRGERETGREKDIERKGRGKREILRYIERGR